MLARIRRSFFVCRVVTPLVLIATLSACYKWADVEMGPALPDHVRVTQRMAGLGGGCLPSAPKYELYSPVLVGDSLVGRMGESTWPQPSVKRFALADICALESRKTDVVLTLGGVALVAGGALLLASAAPPKEKKSGLCYGLGDRLYVTACD